MKQKKLIFENIFTTAIVNFLLRVVRYLTPLFSEAPTKCQQHFQTAQEVLQGPFKDNQCFRSAGIILCRIFKKCSV